MSNRDQKTGDQGNTASPEENTRRDRFLSLISNARVMTLGTGGAHGPWTAPVYYIYQGRGFYFFSNPNSRHILDGMGGLCSTSIYRDADNPSDLQGVQMSGRIRLCLRSAEELKAVLAYVRQYRISVIGKDALAFFRDRFHARFYCFEPEKIYYMENLESFGQRDVIEI